MKDPKNGDAESTILSDDINAEVQAALRESYLQNTEVLRDYAEKVKHFNNSKKAVRGYRNALRDFKSNVMAAARERGIDLCSGDDSQAIAEVFEEHARAYTVGEIEYEMCIPGQVPRTGVNSIELLDNEIARLDDDLATVGDDAQLANIDMQNVLQKQQQTLQMMSNISKVLHDSAMAVIRKIGG